MGNSGVGSGMNALAELAAERQAVIHVGELVPCLADSAEATLQQLNTRQVTAHTHTHAHTRTRTRAHTHTPFARRVLASQLEGIQEK